MSRLDDLYRKRAAMRAKHAAMTDDAAIKRMQKQLETITEEIVAERRRSGES